MKDGLGIPSDLDRLLPAERLRDPKARGVQQEIPRKGREGKKKPTRTGDSGSQEEPRGEPSGEGAPNSGKILDILI